MKKRLLQTFRFAQPTAKQVTLFTKPDCPLCREAEQTTRSVFGRSRVRLVDITGCRELEDVYVFRIPVLVVGETVLAEGRITRAEAMRARQRLLDLQRTGPADT